MTHMDDDCALRFTCSQAVLRGMWQSLPEQDQRSPNASKTVSGAEDICIYSDSGRLRPQRLVSRYSCLARNNACLDLCQVAEVLDGDSKQACDSGPGVHAHGE